MFQGTNCVDDEEQYSDCKEIRADCYNEIRRTPAKPGVIGVDASRHSHESEPVHRKEQHIHANEHRPEIPAPQSLIEHPAGHLREPVVESGEYRKHVDAYEHVMQVRDYEIRVGELPVERDSGCHHAGNTADGEQQYESNHEQERGGSDGTPVPNGREPREHSNRARYRDDHARTAEERESQRRNSGREHVVQPHSESQHSRSHGGERDKSVTHQWPPTERRERVRYDSHRRQYDHVHPGMSENPEQMLPEQRLATRRGIEEVRAVASVEIQEDQGYR